MQVQVREITKEESYDPWQTHPGRGWCKNRKSGLRASCYKTYIIPCFCGYTCTLNTKILCKDFPRKPVFLCLKLNMSTLCKDSFKKNGMLSQDYAFHISKGDRLRLFIIMVLLFSEQWLVPFPLFRGLAVSMHCEE